MKTSSIVFLAVAVITGAATNAFAEGPVLNPPDINAKLNALVEHKMKLQMEVKDTDQVRRSEEKEITRTGDRLSGVQQDTFIYVVSDTRR